LKRAALGFLVLSGLLGMSAWGTPVYVNTLNDTTETTVCCTTNGFTQLGDQIHLAGTERSATQATVQVFSDGDSGTFDATLRFFLVGSPVGSQIGAAFLLTGVVAPANSEVNITFALGGLILPDDVIFTLEVGNFGGGADILGVDMFQGPTVGSSDPSFAIGYDGSTFSHIGTFNEDVYFDLEADQVPTPEPATIGIVGAGLALLLLRRRR
jgi:PEP-CTERM motif